MELEKRIPLFESISIDKTKLTESAKDLKKKLLAIANNNIKEDIPENKAYWKETIKSLESTDDQKKLESIAEDDFGYLTMDEINKYKS
jgi:hypothetical protein